MPPFTTEERVRAQFHLHDTVLVPASDIDTAIEDAHEHVLRELAPDAPADPPVQGLILGETYLAGARLFQALAAKEAFDQKRVSLGESAVQDGDRFRSLTAVAAMAEKHGWRVLEPFMATRPSRQPATATDSVAVLGET